MITRATTIETQIRGEGAPQGWAGFKDDLAALRRSRFVITSLVTTQLKLRYHRSLLGIGWTLLNPLLLLGVQALAFSQILNFDIRTYSLFLLSGLIPWQFFSNAIDQSSRTLMAHEGLIRVLPARKIIFPLADLTVSLVHSGFTLLAFFLLLPFMGGQLRPQLAILPPAILLMAGFTFGLALITMTLLTMFRDFSHILGVLLTACYFASPILYPPGVMQNYRAMLRLNPMTYFLELFHAALLPTGSVAGLGGAWPSLETWAIASVATVVSLEAGYLVYKRFEHEYVFYL